MGPCGLGMMDGMDRAALADFLRRRRDALDPAEVGLDAGPRRRAPGLRREEVAHLTGMSVDYYVRMEQARSTQPSPQMLQALSRTLRLDADGRDHLFRLAGHPAPARTGATSHVRPMLLRVLDDLRDSAAMVVSDLGVVLAQNRLNVLLLGTAPEAAAWQRAPPGAGSPIPTRGRVSRSRITSTSAGSGSPICARPGPAGPVPPTSANWSTRCSTPATSSAHSGSCTRSRYDAANASASCTPRSALLDLECEVLTRPDDGQALVILSAPSGSPEIEKLRLVAVLGAQALT